MLGWTPAILFFLILLFRTGYVLLCMRRPIIRRKSDSEACSIAIFLGSGGHTSEMLSLISSLDTGRYHPRLYIVSEGDAFSAKKAAELEQRLNASPDQSSTVQVPRARRVHQSLLATPPTALWSLTFCLKLLVQPSHKRGDSFPDLLVMNGPGTCFTLCLAVLLCRILGLSTPRTVYIESFTRVSSLSAAGKLVKPLVDRFIVQWPSASKDQECKGWLV